MALTDEKKNNVNTEDVIDISLDAVKRTRFRINGDNDAIIQLNLSDLGIIDRLSKGLSKLEKDMTQIANLDSESDDFSEQLKAIDQQMRDTVDYIFDYPVSAACVKYGTMYDPKDGKFCYEAIIEKLMQLYTDNINEEYKKLQNRVKKHTDKYTAPKGKRK